MALEKVTEVGSIEVLPMGQIQVRTDTVIKEDGKEISRRYHRHVVEPNHNTAKEDQRVKEVAEAVHTKKVKDAWAEHTANAFKS
ncbi:uncharacterized protein METZ01_LOCUS46657 [marine metagenome]|uniref:Uncharacterized protein n=1 Tax=marine metagenome TaxID=408172 RepID=A0A381RY01_9ZZZZ